jgi:hypothetical protein
MPDSYFLQNAENCDEPAAQVRGQVAIWHSGKATDQAEPAETPLDDPRQQTDWPNTKQTDEPWKGNPEKDQLDPKRPDIDLEKWQESNTH